MYSSRSSTSLGTCEIYRRAVASGEHPSDVVGELAAMEGVQRPAIWRRLRAGGVIPPYQNRTLGGGRPYKRSGMGRRSAGIMNANFENIIPPTEPVHRDPCPRCGVRGDIGCKCSKAALGMML